MYGDVAKDSDKELRQRIEEGYEELKAIREALNEEVDKLWNLREKERELRNLIADCKIELGRRKGEKCKAFKRISLSPHPVAYKYYTCLASEAITSNTFGSSRELFKNRCSKCKWSKEEIETRMLMIRIKGK